MTSRAAGSALLASFLASCGDDVAAVDAAPDAPIADGQVSIDAAQGMPDLTVDPDRARVDLALRTAEFAGDACELDPDEECIGAPGLRRLLHFSVETPNLGDGDMFLGEPDPGNPNFQFSACHAHYHFVGYAAYRLLDAEGAQVAAGRKQAFCLLDSSRYVTDDPTVAESPRYTCGLQGIQRGWSDLYEASLPCQFVDVTDVPDGAYTLEIELNSERGLVERDYDNNLVSIPVDLASPDLARPTEPCPEDIAERPSTGVHRECGWQPAATFACEPGSDVTLRCGPGSSCAESICDGDPMLRVCDAGLDPTCSFPAALRSSDDSGGGLCPCGSVACPPSGQLAVFTGPSRVGQPFECAIQAVPSSADRL